MAESQKNKAILAEIKAKALRDAEFKKKLLADPTKVFRDAGSIFEPNLKVKVVENTADTRYVVLPFVAACKLSDEALAAVAGGDSTATTTNTVQTVEVATTQTEASETSTTQHAEAETTVVGVAEIVAT